MKGREETKAGGEEAEEKKKCSECMRVYAWKQARPKSRDANACEAVKKEMPSRMKWKIMEDGETGMMVQ